VDIKASNCAGRDTLIGTFARYLESKDDIKCEVTCQESHDVETPVQRKDDQKQKCC
jgi:hypothetical protein